MRSTRGVKFGADADFLGWGLWAGTLWLSQMRIKDANTGPALKQEGQDGAACHAHVISACGLNTVCPAENITEGIFMNSLTFHYSRNQGKDGSALGLG